MYFNSYGMGNNGNNYNPNFNKQQNNRKSPVEQKPNPTGIFLLLLLVLTVVIMFFHVIDVIQTNKKLEEEMSEKMNNKNDEIEKNEIEENNDNNKENSVEKDEEKETNPEKKPTIEETNKEELVKLCKLIDSKGSYQYEEYVNYVNSFNSKDLTIEEKYEIMSKKNYCYNNSCVKIEKEGIINYVNCNSGEFSRITFEEYQKLQVEQAKININLTNACMNLDSKGYYDSGVATGIRVKCENYVCSLDYEGEKISKNCKEK